MQARDTEAGDRWFSLVAEGLEASATG